MNILVTGTNDLEVNGVNTEVYKAARTITISGNVIETITGTRELTIGNTNKETYKGKRTITVSGDLIETITGKYELHVKDTSQYALNVSTTGGLFLTSGNTIGKEILINSNARFTDIVYYTPEVISTANLSTNTNDNSRLTIDPKVLTIIAAAPGSGQSRYLTLANGVYNGQIKKIALHPMWNGTNIDIKVSRFCDADGNISTNARLILNKGGQTLNLLYIDDATDLSDGYWMLLDNNFDFV